MYMFLTIIGGISWVLTLIGCLLLFIQVLLNKDESLIFDIEVKSTIASSVIAIISMVILLLI